MGIMLVATCKLVKQNILTPKESKQFKNNYGKNKF